MKNAIFSAIIMAFVLVSCSQKNKAGETNTSETTTEHADQMYACPMHPEVTGKKGQKCSKCGMELTEPVAQTKLDNVPGKNSTDKDSNVALLGEDSQITSSDYMNDIVTSYINLKNELANDDSNAAADKGKKLLQSFNRLDTKTLNESQKKEYLDIADDAKENAEHIGDNAGKIDHQREHFVLLSKDINDLIKIFGTKRQLYQDYCPMANDGKGAIWISEIKEIKNPYMGSKMQTCGSVKKVM